MREIQTGEIIGTVECPGCGAQTPLKINSRKNVYFFCAKRLGEKIAGEKQEVCLTRMNYGRTGSKKIIEQFLATEEKPQNAEYEAREAQNGNDDSASASIGGHATATIPERGDTFGSALLRFLTE